MTPELELALAAYLTDSPAARELTAYFATSREPGGDPTPQRNSLRLRSPNASKALALAEETLRINNVSGWLDAPVETIEPLARAYLCLLEQLTYSHDAILPLITYESYRRTRLRLNQRMHDETQSDDARATAKECLQFLSETLCCVR